MSVIKRDGSIVPFDATKIVNAVNKAFIEVDGKLYENDTATDIAMEIGDAILKLSNSIDVSVEQIQDKVEEYLMRSERPDVARAYIRYRYKKEIARNYQKDFIDAIRAKLEGRNIVNQNANVDEQSFGGRNGEASSVVNKKLALDYIISPMARSHHINNEIYIHDLDHYYLGDHNCLSIPFDELLAKGFNTRQTDVRTAGSVNTACQLVAVIFQLQSLQQFGGVSATHIDWTMVPYIRKSFHKHFRDGIVWVEHRILDCTPPDGVDVTNLAIDGKFYKDLECPNAYDYAMIMTEREIYQAVEGLYHNLNTLQSRSGNQLKWMAG